MDVGFEAIKGAGTSQQLSTACDLVDKRIEDSFGFILVGKAEQRCSVLLYTQKLEVLEKVGIRCNMTPPEQVKNCQIQVKLAMI